MYKVSKSVLHIEKWTRFLKKTCDEFWLPVIVLAYFWYFEQFSFSGVPYMSYFSNLKTYGYPETKIWPHIIAQKA